MNRRQSFLYVHLSAAFAVVLFFVAIPPLVSYLYKVFYYQPRIDKMERHFDSVQARMMKDLQLLEEEPLFAPTEWAANAHSVIIQHTGWLAKSSSVGKSDWSDRLSKIKALRFMEYSKHEFLHLYTQWHTSGVDVSELSWIDDLRDYDHWNFTTSKEYAAELSVVEGLSSIERMSVAAILPIPDFSTLRTQAVVYFLHKYTQGKSQEALAGIRRLAQLTQSSGALIGQMTALQLLELGNHLREAFDVVDVHQVASATIAAYKRVTWAWAGVFNLSAMTGRVSPLMKYASRQNGVCSAAFELPLGLNAFGDFLDKQWPMEMDILGGRGNAREHLAVVQKNCGAETLAAFQKPLPPIKWWSGDKLFAVAQRSPAAREGKSHLQVNLAKVPYIRQMVGMALSSLAAPNYFTLYDSQKNGN